MRPLLAVLPRTLVPMKDHAMRSDAAVNPESNASVMQIDQRAAPGLRNHSQRILNHRLAVAQCRSKNVPGQTMGVNPHSHRLITRHVAINQGHMRLAAIDLALVGDHAELAMTGW